MNTIGRIFRVSIFGESHGNGIGVVIDGVPPGIPLAETDFLSDLSRRRSGAAGTTPRIEPDLPKLMSGVWNGFTTGAPLSVFFENTNTKSADYDNLRDIPRPGHSDFTARIKFKGYADPRGGGHFSGRITLGLVAAGVVAKKIIDPVFVSSQILELGGDSNIARAIENITGTSDSIGGIIQITATNMPQGLGEPFFGSVESTISQLIFSIPAIKGIEFGSGFSAARMRGSQHNDAYINTKGKTLTNNAAGINGGITNGNDLVFRIVVKPTSSISLPQETINMKTGKIETLKIEGRHDVCIALRVPVVAEAAAAIGLADLFLLSKALK
ncbi:MAG: chorismate synthase [Bacteroidetes bacterium HGW-Bacteroidetes-11]|jgi:chorismate synthase|nr:MAG: chorismate synthase [Bacteroidetes bacterium HGW-Bacteroidetes-11]